MKSHQHAGNDHDCYFARDDRTHKCKNKQGRYEYANIHGPTKGVSLSSYVQHGLSVRFPTRTDRITFPLSEVAVGPTVIP